MESMSELSHHFVEPALHRQAVCIDATLGHGRDAAFFLDRNVRHVFAYEIQPDLARQTAAALDTPRLHVQAGSHAGLEDDLKDWKGKVDAVLFNFGYDPKNPSGIRTRLDSSLPAVLGAIRLLRPKGRMALVFYSHEEGIEERQAIVRALHHLSGIECLEIRHPFKPDAPVLVCIEKTHADRDHD